MNTILNNLLNAARNKHISVPLYLAIVLEIIPIWFPEYKQQCSDTQKLLLGYGVIAAANTGPTAVQTTAPSAPAAQKPTTL